MIWKYRRIALAVLVSASGVACGQVEPNLWTYVLSGDSAAPGVSIGGFSGVFEFNDNGALAFRADLVGQDVDASNNDSIFLFSDAVRGPELVARTGERIELFTFGMLFNERNQIAYNAVAGDAGESADAVFLNGAIVARDGDTPSDWGDRDVPEVGLAGLDDSGQVYLRQGYRAFGSGRTAYTKTAGDDLTSIFLPPEIEVGTDVVELRSVTDFRVSGSGEIVGRANLLGGGTDSTNDYAVVRLLGDRDFEIIEREGTSDPKVFSGPLRISNSGVISTGLQSIFINGNEILTANQSVGQIDGVQATINRAINNLGDFSAEVRFNPVSSSSNDNAIVSSVGGDLHVIAMEGDLGIRAFGQVELNDLGQTAFSAFETSSFRRSIYVTDIEGVLRRVVREGDMIDVLNGEGVDFRAISGLGNFALNNFGELAYFAEFSDGSSGYFLADVSFGLSGVPSNPNNPFVPSPATLAILGFSGGLATRRLRK